MSAAVSYYPPAGAVLSLVSLLPLLLGFFSGHIWVQAWGYLLFSVWLTRALHLDGLADICDALGSGKTGDGFYSVLKDSRLGAFGAVGLFFVVSGMLLLTAAMLEQNRLAPLFFAPLFGRCLPIVLACLAPANPRAGLGAILATAPKRPALGIAAFFAGIGGVLCLGVPTLLLCLALTAPCVLMLASLARREQGYNGDFFGCIIICGELAVLLSALSA